MYMCSYTENCKSQTVIVRDQVQASQALNKPFPIQNRVPVDQRITEFLYCVIHSVHRHHRTSLRSSTLFKVRQEQISIADKRCCLPISSSLVDALAKHFQMTLVWNKPLTQSPRTFKSPNPALTTTVGVTTSKTVLQHSEGGQDWHLAFLPVTGPA